MYFVIMLSGWCRTRMRPARLVSYAFLYTTEAEFQGQLATLEYQLQEKTKQQNSAFHWLEFNEQLLNLSRQEC